MSISSKDNQDRSSEASQAALITDGETPGNNAPGNKALGNKAHGNGQELAIREVVLADRKLVDRCLAGEVAAWEEMYRQYHQPLLASISMLLGQKSTDPNLAEEIAARVWYSLTAKDNERLNRFDIQRDCRLTTYLALLARDEAMRYFRSERRRRNREQASSSLKLLHYLTDDEQPAKQIMEFMTLLTPREKGFCEQFLITSQLNGDETSRKSPEVQEEKFSQANQWQLRHRIHKKLIRFMDETA